MNIFPLLNRGEIESKYIILGPNIRVTKVPMVLLSHQKSDNISPLNVHFYCQRLPSINRGYS